MHRISPVALLSLLLAACVVPGPSGIAAPGAPPLNGQWGGAHVQLTLDERGGTIEYDCANGRLDGPVVPAADGTFSVSGTLAREGGPARIDAPAASVPARYTGRVSGDRMQLQVRAQGAALDPFALQRGAQAQLFKCL